MEILVAIDQTLSSHKVLESAVDIAKMKNANLTVLTVAETILDLDEMLEHEKIQNQLLERATVAIENAKEYASRNNLAINAIVIPGPSPADIILDYASKNSTNLIIVGSREKKGLERFVIGSVASKVVSHATCSVFVVR
jgi:nucleotide-binding universal stress UspA family protein